MYTRLFLLLTGVLFASNLNGAQCDSRIVSSQVVGSCLQLPANGSYGSCELGGFQKCTTVPFSYQYTQVDFVRAQVLTTDCQIVQRDYQTTAPKSALVAGSFCGVGYVCEAAQGNAEQKAGELIAQLRTRECH